MPQTKRLKLALNSRLIDKNISGNTSLYAKGWQNAEVTSYELADYINAGVAYCPQLIGSQDTTRKGKNFLCSDVVSVDVDGTRRISDILHDPFIKQCLTILYTTPSHTEETHRFRLVFALSRTITSAADMTAASLSLALQLSGDRSATDAARLFFGSRGSKPKVFDGFIPHKLLDELIEEGKRANQPDSFSPGALAATTVSNQNISHDQMIRTEGGAHLSFFAVDVSTRVHCPFHFDNEASAFVLQSRTGTKGLRCSRCAKTFWPRGASAPAYDFLAFDKKVKEAAAYFEKHQDPQGVFRFADHDEAAVHVGLHRSNIRIDSRPYLGRFKVEPGITLIKSPKGTGKTESLAQAIRDEKKVLLIGHRVSLIGQSCKRLGLNNYLDYPEGPISDWYVGICLDSLLRLVWTERRDFKSVKKYNEFHTVIIDESEQVLSHFMSDTIERDERRKIFLLFRRLLQQARSVIALDADLGWLTFETLTKLVNEVPGTKRTSRYFSSPDGESNVRPCRIILNEHKASKALQLFESEEHLTADLMQALGEGKRVFVTSNSKRRINDLSELIRSTFGADVPLLEITSDTSGNAGVKSFISDVRTEALKYNVILASPSMSTGVDIAFDGNAEMIDTVYGFFQHLITTHFDVDQQLARVRHPGAVKVWITPFRYRFDTAFDVIKTEIQERETYTSLLTDFDEHLRPEYHTDHPFTDMAALAVSQQRASKNDLKANFLALKLNQGFEIQYQLQDEHAFKAGRELVTEARKLSSTKRNNMLLSAEPLRKAPFVDVIERLKQRDEVGSADRWSLARTRIELFYRSPITERLVALDDNGRLRDKIVRLEKFLSVCGDADKLPAKPWNNIDLSKKFEMRFVHNPNYAPVLIFHLLNHTAVLAGGRFVTSASLTKDDLLEFSVEALRLKPFIENILKVHVRSDVKRKPVMLLNNILDQIGLCLGPAVKQTRSSKATYRYNLNDDILRSANELASLRKQCGAWDALYRMHSWNISELVEDDD